MSTPEDPKHASTKASTDETNTKTPVTAQPSAKPSKEISMPENTISQELQEPLLANEAKSNPPPESLDTKDRSEWFGSSATPAASVSSNKETPEPPAPSKIIGGKEAQKPGFFSAHPVLHTTPQLPASLSSRLFNMMGYTPWLFLSLLIIAQTIFSLDSRALWYSDEVRHANAFMSMLENGKWFVLEMNGQLYPDKPPLYFWLLRGLHYLIPTTGPLLYFAAAAISGMLYLWSMLALGRFVGRFDGKMLFASGIILLTTGYVIGTLHYARMDLLFSAFIIASHVAFFIAYSKQRALLLMLFAFMCAALACLIKGPLGILLPLLTSIIFLCWRGTPMRLFKLDVLAGFVFAMAIIGCWAVGLFMETEGTDFLVNEILNKHILQRATDTFHHKQPWHYYLLRLPFMLLPWFFLLICLPWHHLFSKSTVNSIKESRHPQKEGLAFLWIMALSPLLLLSALSGKIMIYYLPALPALALLGGKAVLELSVKRAAFFRALLIIFMLLAGIACIVASLALFNFIDLSYLKGIPAWTLPVNSWFFLVAAIIFIAGFSLWFLLRRSNPEGVLIMMALASIAITIPLYRFVAPSLDVVLSPQQQALVMKQYIEQGYEPLNYKVYDGIYSYYANHAVPSVPSLDQMQELVESKKIILALRRTHWDAWENKPECLTEVHRQWVETKEYILAACPALPKTIDPTAPESLTGLPPAPEEVTPISTTVEPITPKEETSDTNEAPRPDTVPVAPEDKNQVSAPQNAPRSESNYIDEPPLSAHNATVIDPTIPDSTEKLQNSPLPIAEDTLTAPTETKSADKTEEASGNEITPARETVTPSSSVNGTGEHGFSKETNSTTSSSSD